MNPYAARALGGPVGCGAEYLDMIPSAEMERYFFEWIAEVLSLKESDKFVS